MKTLEHLTLFAPACLSVSKDRGVGDGGWMGGPIDVLRVWLGIGVQIFLFFWHTETILQGKKRNALFQTYYWEKSVRVFAEIYANTWQAPAPPRFWGAIKNNDQSITDIDEYQ